MQAQNNDAPIQQHNGQIPANGGHQQQNMAGPQPMAQISAAEWAAKFPTKRETYNFLAVDCDYYLPPLGKYHSALSLISSSM